MSFSETIFALASGRGRAGVAVVRISGPGSVDALETLSGKSRPVTCYIISGPKQFHW